MTPKLHCLFGLLLLLTVAVPAEAALVRISAAASLTDAFKELIAGYRQQHPQQRLLANFASSGALARQIDAGAPADIYISANPMWLQYLQQQGLISAASERILVRNRLVFVASSGSADSLEQLPQLARIALGSPKSTPVGRYTEQALNAAGLYSRLQQGRQLVFAKDVRQALLYAERGEVDGAFVYQTDALQATEAKVLFTVPAQLYPQPLYPAALTVDGQSNPAAGAFFAYLFSAAAQQLLRDYGFVTDD